MKNISFLLKNVLEKKLEQKSSVLFIKKTISNIIFEKTNIKINFENINIVGDILKLKSKPIIKHKIILNSGEILDNIKTQTGLGFNKII